MNNNTKCYYILASAVILILGLDENSVCKDHSFLQWHFRGETLTSARFTQICLCKMTFTYFKEKSADRILGNWWHNNYMRDRNVVFVHFFYILDSENSRRILKKVLLHKENERSGLTVKTDNQDRKGATFWVGRGDNWS